MSEYELDLLTEEVYLDMSNHTNDSLRLFAWRAEHNACWHNNESIAVGVAAFVLAIILASCGWPT